MDLFNSSWRGRPSHLTVACHQCNASIPYQPNNDSGLCYPCQNMVSAEMSSHMPTTFPELDQDGFESPLEQDFTSHYGASSSPLVRRTVMGAAGHLDNSFTSTANDGDSVDDDDDDDDVEFLDAREEVSSTSGDDTPGSGYDEDDDMMLEPDGTIPEQGLGGGGEDDKGEEEDLFERTFGSSSRESRDNDETSVDGEPEKVDHEKVVPQKAKSVAASTARSNGSTKVTHKTAAQLPSSNIGEAPGPPNPEKDISWNLRRLKRFHDRAIELIPRLPLADRRYWIGVLNVSSKLENFGKEKDFTWMKGNRLTTVETIWHMYQQTTAVDGFVLLMGYEPLDFKDKVEELDYFNDKKIIFRAVQEDHPDARGRELCEFVIPKASAVKMAPSEVIKID